MRAVIYTDDLEPITVINLGEWAVNFLMEHGNIRFPVYPIHPLYSAEYSENPVKPIKFYEVVLRIEWFMRKGKRTFFVFTDDETSALLLESTFLPGQRKELKDEKAKAFAEGFYEAIQRLH